MWGVSSVSIPPSFGRRCPQGGGWATQSGVKKERLKSTIYESTRAPLTRSPFPDVEGKLVAATPRSMAQVAAVLAFVISHTTFLSAQDDETGRCPKVC